MIYGSRNISISAISGFRYISVYFSMYMDHVDHPETQILLKRLDCDSYNDNLSIVNDVVDKLNNVSETGLEYVPIPL